MRKIMMLSLCFLLTISQLWAQNRTIKGKVLNEKGEALAKKVNGEACLIGEIYEVL